MVASWSVAYLVKSFSNEFYQLDPAQITDMWKGFLANPWHLLGWHSTFMFLTMIVLAKGVKHGLEKATKFMMPALYVILFILVIYAFSLFIWKF